MRLLRITGNSIFRKLRAIVSEATCCTALWKDSNAWLDDCSWVEEDHDFLWNNPDIWNNEQTWPTE